jgi:hypothetical protein
MRSLPAQQHVRKVFSLYHLHEPGVVAMHDRKGTQRDQSPFVVQDRVPRYVIVLPGCTTMVNV